MRVLVTGATGYIGGRLVPRLRERGYDVRCLARAGSGYEAVSTLQSRWSKATSPTRLR